MHSGRDLKSTLINDTPVYPKLFRATLSRFASGVTVVTALSPAGVPHGVTASSFTSVSLEPPLVQWSLRNESSSFAIFAKATHYAVSILADDQHAISERFSSPQINRFADLDVELGMHNLPLIAGALAWLECKLTATHLAGDHSILVGRVLRAHFFDRRPLLHWCGRYLPIGE